MIYTHVHAILMYNVIESFLYDNKTSYYPLYCEHI